MGCRTNSEPPTAQGVRQGRPRVAAFVLLLGALGLLAGCSDAPDDAEALFRLRPASHTGIAFSNEVVESDTLNALTFHYIYNGGGVGVGDVNGDGWPDLYFTGNMVSSRLYLNRGNMQFEDVTAEAGVGTDRWVSGVTMVDINQDGRLDIYVGASGMDDRRNLLFVNDGVDARGVPQFSEQAAAYGIDANGYTTHAAFFDYDRDGDLDLYLLNGANEKSASNIPQPRRVSGEAASTDRLYRNEGNGTFTDVSAAAGIQIEGYGLGLAINDYDADGWPDVYVANDYLSNDLLYLNNGDGTFANGIRDVLKHQSYSAMGADAADVNNDGWVDLVVLDMMPPGKTRQKLMSGTMSYDGYRLSLARGYEPQFVRNTLQLHYGLAASDSLPRFGEIGRLAGVHHTDWSWAPLLVDLDNDGYRDLFVTNGYRKDLTDLDFVSYRAQQATRHDRTGFLEAVRPALDELPGIRIPNYAFRNEGDLTFTDQSIAWGFGRATYSNGAAFADLDQDGDVDVVVSNVNEAVQVHENTAERYFKTPRHYLRVRLDGPPANRRGYGTTLQLFYAGTRQAHRHTVYRGYQSTVENVAHFGLGAHARVDSLRVVWPDGRAQVLHEVAADQVVRVDYREAGAPVPDEELRALIAGARPEAPLFEDVTEAHGVAHRHAENQFVDFEYEPLLPHMYSQNGPGLSVGDVDGDGLDDFFVGGASKQAGHLFTQAADGSFAGRPIPQEDAGAKKEDLHSVLFDADGDGDRDLYVVSGGSEFAPRSPFYHDRLYVNDGRGRFTKAGPEALPPLPTSGQAVAAADYDGDGDQDLFVGGRVVPGHYPYPAASYLLENRTAPGGPPRFVQAATAQPPGWDALGMVTDALWSDFDDDGRPDLVVAGEWMPVRFYRNTGQGLEDVTAETGLAEATGWWNSLAAGDFDGDGDTDYLAGNLGLNATLKASPEEPVRVYAKDFDRNGTLDAVLSRYIQGEEFPIASRDVLLQQIHSLRSVFSDYRSYAEAAFHDVLPEAELADAYVREATTFESSYLENLGAGRFRRHALPVEAQVAPVQDMAVADYDGDGRLDALLVGNLYATEVAMGRYDASTGLYLKGLGDGRFTARPGPAAGFLVDGDARAVAPVETASGPRVVTALNDGPLQVWRWGR